ncbi:hybrid sensor histidine kinase/response regulator [Ramlibacter paludis]|uniref:hybrid sensor histidine kinase/response regulator n=1 Tax=Ramlibacter paludis TaxID=2908000 RepID=UPI0023DC1236
MSSPPSLPFAPSRSEWPTARSPQKLRLRSRVLVVAAALVLVLACLGAGLLAGQALQAGGSPGRFWLIALVLALVVVAAAWIASGRMARPMTRLAQQAAAAEASVSLPPPSAPLPLESDAGAVERALRRLARSAQENQQQLARNERQFAALAESLPHVIWVADAQGRLEYVNRPWLSDVPLNVADLARFADPTDRGRITQAWQQSLESGEPLRLRCRLLAPGAHKQRWTDVQAAPIPGEGASVLRWVGSLVDVDESVMLAQMQERALEEERRARADAEQLARTRDDFLGAVSHELRSPLSAINGWAEILARKGHVDPMVAKAGEVIRRNAQIQTGLIDDLLDLTTMTAGRLEVAHEVLDLARVAREVVTSHLAAAQAKGLALDWRRCEAVFVEGDERRLAQVVANVLTNAIKFTPAGGRVDLSSAVEDGRAVLRVADSGRGISAAFLPHVFDRLRQEDGMAAARTGGLGLGLAIARGIVELHGGAIAIASEGPGKGTTVTIALPLSAATSEEGAHRASMAALDPGFDLLGAKVLLVDDEADAREVAKVALTSMGAHVQLATSGAEALEAVQRQRFDFLVSDIGMPGMDGLELIRKVRGLGQPHGQVPAVALSAFALAGDVAAGLEAGFHAYAAKPISLRGLATAIVTAQKRVGSA